MSTVGALPTDTTVLTVGRADEIFLDSLRNPNTIHGYGIVVGKPAEKLGERRALAPVAGLLGRDIEDLDLARRYAPVSLLLLMAQSRHKKPENVVATSTLRPDLGGGHQPAGAG